MRMSKTASPLKIEPIICPETSVGNYQCTLRNVPEERISHGPRHSFRGNDVEESKIYHLNIWRFGDGNVWSFTACNTSNRHRKNLNF
jgi:hypothetical protein